MSHSLFLLILLMVGRTLDYHPSSVGGLGGWATGRALWPLAETSSRPVSSQSQGSLVTRRDAVARRSPKPSNTIATLFLSQRTIFPPTAAIINAIHSPSSPPQMARLFPPLEAKTPLASKSTHKFHASWSETSETRWQVDNPGQKCVLGMQDVGCDGWNGEIIAALDNMLHVWNPRNPATHSPSLPFSFRCGWTNEALRAGVWKFPTQ